MSPVVQGGPLENRLPCGCVRAVFRRTAPAFDEKTGRAVLNPDGTFRMTEQETIEDRFCDEHAAIVRMRQIAVDEAMKRGVPALEAMKLLTGASPLAALRPRDGEDEEGKDDEDGADEEPA